MLVMDNLLSSFRQDQDRMCWGGCQVTVPTTVFADFQPIEEFFAELKAHNKRTGLDYKRTRLVGIMIDKIWVAAIDRGR